MIWYKIENYLFENYGIEGCYDDELCRLMDKHDKEIRDILKYRKENRISANT